METCVGQVRMDREKFWYYLDELCAFVGIA